MPGMRLVTKMGFLRVNFRATRAIFSLLAYLLSTSSFAAVEGAVAAPTAVTGIESLYSQQFSEKIFYFLVFSIVLFTIIVFAFMFGGSSKKLKTGEKWLFALIFFGIVVAIVFGATQMLDGMLF